jgi:hypothetical protein
MSTPPSPIEPEGVFDGLRWSAILSGAILDNVLTFLILTPLVIYFAGPDALSQNEETSSAAIERVMGAPKYLIGSFVVGTLITTFAAFWAARRAGVSFLRHGGWTAVMSAALALVLFVLPGASSGPPSPWWYDALAYALMIPAGVFGGWLASKAAPPTT